MCAISRPVSVTANLTEVREVWAGPPCFIGGYFKAHHAIQGQIFWQVLVHIQGENPYLEGLQLTSGDGEELPIAALQKKQRTFVLRNTYVHTHVDLSEWLFLEWYKAVNLTIGYPVHALIMKIALPLLVYLPIKALGACLGGRCALLQGWIHTLEEDYHCKRAWSLIDKYSLCGHTVYIPRLLVLRAIIALIVHPLISAFALIPGLSSYFNKLNGDVERWVNGHTDEDVRGKTLARRLNEAHYMAPCQQPLFQVRQEDVREGSIQVNTLEVRTQKAALRAVMTGSLSYPLPGMSKRLYAPSD